MEPTVETYPASMVGLTTVQLNAEVTDDGGSSITWRGFVYDSESHDAPDSSTPPNETDYANFIGQHGTFGEAIFNRAVSGLSQNKTFYVRAFAQNTTGYSYGDEIEFTTEYDVPPSFTPPAKTSPEFQILVRNKEGDIIGEFLDWQNLQFSDKMNNYGVCTFDIPVTSDELISLTSLRRYETLIVRNGVIVWSGEQAQRDGNLRANDPQLVTITSYTFVEMLNSRVTPSYVRYEAEDQGQILKDLVDVSQALPNGDLGLTFASIPATVDRDREYQTYNLMEAFINMSNLKEGVDFWIDEDKVVHIVPFRGIDKSTQVIFEWGVNMDTLHVSEDFSNPANEAVVLGSETVVVTDSVSGENYGLRQKVVSEIDISEEQTLEDKGEAYIRKYKTALMTVDFTQIPNTIPTFNSLQLGDSVRVRITEGIYNVNNVFRIYGYTVTVGPTGEENISYLIAQI